MLETSLIDANACIRHRLPAIDIEINDMALVDFNQFDFLLCIVCDVRVARGSISGDRTFGLRNGIGEENQGGWNTERSL
jgi:hypothetical protein